MGSDALFCHLSSSGIAGLIRTAKRSVCYAGPGIQLEPARAMAEIASRLGPEMLTVSLDFDERVMRMGYGEIAAVETLRHAGIMASHAPGLRSALVIVDGEGYTFTPTPLYLEAESGSDTARNALRLSREQVAEALARLSPAAKAIAVAQANSPEEQARITDLPVEVGSDRITEMRFDQVDKSLKEAPPVKFDLARQVRVFEPILQYVELSLAGAAIQRHRLTIPPSIEKLGGSEDLEGRIRTTFVLIEKDSGLSSKLLEKDLNEIRKNLTRSLGKHKGRVVLKSAKPLLEKRLEEFREKIETHREKVEAELQQRLDKSCAEIINHYLPRVIESPPDSLRGQLLSAKPTNEAATQWLDTELDSRFPTAKSLTEVMKLEERFMDVTFETLNHGDFLKSVKSAYPKMDWDKLYDEFRAAGESDTEEHTE